TAVNGIANFERSQLRSVLLGNVACVEGPDALEVLYVCGCDLGELRIPLRALASAISAPLSCFGRIRCIFEERFCSRLWQRDRFRMLIEDRNEDAERNREDSNADQTPLACSPSYGLVE